MCCKTFRHILVKSNSTKFRIHIHTHTHTFYITKCSNSILAQAIVNDPGNVVLDRWHRDVMTKSFQTESKDIILCFAFHHLHAINVFNYHYRTIKFYFNGRLSDAICTKCIYIWCLRDHGDELSYKLMWCYYLNNCHAQLFNKTWTFFILSTKFYNSL